jgi:acyl-CoA thioesterase
VDWVDGGYDLLLGGHLLAATVVAAERFAGRPLVSLHAMFSRAGAPRPSVLSVDPLAAGRTWTSLTVTGTQDGRPHYRGLVLLAEPGAGHPVEHAAEAPVTGGPGAAKPVELGFLPWEVRVVGGREALVPDGAAPPEVDVWIRCREAESPTLSRALLAHTVETLFFTAAVRPHAGRVDLLDLHRGASVLTQTFVVHEHFSLDQWVLVHFDGVYAGGGRQYGRGQVFTADGRLVASTDQIGLLGRPG